MNRTPLIFLGILATFSASWLGLVVAPHHQLGNLGVHIGPDGGAGVPVARPGEAQQGAQVYRELGCNQCHTQQARPEAAGNDLARGWGFRRSVARDVVHDTTILLGSIRLGPDLAAYGDRCPTNPAVLLTRLYEPRAVVTNSMCPSQHALFSVGPVGKSGPSTEALVLPKEFAPGVGREVVPTLEARQLAAYLKSLSTAVDLPEAPFNKKTLAAAAPAPAATPAPAPAAAGTPAK